MAQASGGSHTALQARRWHLVGNAVSVVVAEWIGQRLADPLRYKYCAGLRDQSFPWEAAPDRALVDNAGALCRRRLQAELDFMVGIQELCGSSSDPCAIGPPPHAGKNPSKAQKNDRMLHTGCTSVLMLDICN